MLLNPRKGFIREYIVSFTSILTMPLRVYERLGRNNGLRDLSRLQQQRIQIFERLQETSEDFIELQRLRKISET